MSHPGYRLTDADLLSRHLTHEQKLTLAVTLALPGRDASLDQLAAWLPFRRETANHAQYALDRDGIAAYHFPAVTGRREANSPRFTTSNRIIRVRSSSEPNRRRGQAQQHSTSLPGGLAEQLPSGKGQSNATLATILTMLYAREQIKRGAIQLGDEAAAELLSVDARPVKLFQARDARKALMASGVLRQLRRTRDGAVYMLDGIPHDPERKLDPAKTIKLRTLEYEADWSEQPVPVTILATEKEHQAVYHYFARLSDIAIESALALGGEDDLDEEGFALHAGPLLAALREADQSFRRLAKMASQTPGEAHLASAAPEAQTPGEAHATAPGEAHGSFPTPSFSSHSRLSASADVKTSSNEDEGDRGTRHTDTPAAATPPAAASKSAGGGGEGLEVEGEPPTVPTVERWSIPESPGLYVFADADTRSKLTDYIEAMDANYGAAERNGFMREYSLRCSGSGRRLLGYLDGRFGHLVRHTPKPDAGARDRSTELAEMFATLSAE